LCDPPATDTQIECDIVDRGARDFASDRWDYDREVRDRLISITDSQHQSQPRPTTPDKTCQTARTSCTGRRSTPIPDSSKERMEFRQLGRSGLNVPLLSLGTGTFGGSNDFFKAWGSTGVDEATRIVDICLEAGLNLFDTADIYSDGLAEEVLGNAIAGRRDSVLISTKGAFRTGPGPNDIGTSRWRLIRAVEASLRRLGTDYIDIYQLHGFDPLPAFEETLGALDTLVRAGKIRTIGCSNYSGWHLMKSLAVSERYGWARFAVHQAYYSLIGRDFEWELMPLALEEGVGTLVWSPLGWGRLTGKIRRGEPPPATSRLPATIDAAPPADNEYIFRVVDALDEIARETGKSVPQIALNWLAQRPTISSIIIGARNEEQLRANLAAVGWTLAPEQVAKLDAASAVTPAYPYWHQRGYERNPPPV
jgi:aryl-alcohol dehydrogenase-like predicted oxidoreductase